MHTSLVIFTSVFIKHYFLVLQIAGDPKFREDFEFIKVDIQKPGVMPLVRSFGVRGIPTIAVFDHDGELLAYFGGSFRKMNAVKANLVVIAANIGSSFMTDPNGFVIPKPE